jgi:hypothetical protein
VISDTKSFHENKTNVLITALSAWIMAAATLLGSTQVSRQPVVVNMARPAYAYINPGLNVWNRNDNENETVHMPTKFDIGVQGVEVGGRK